MGIVKPRIRILGWASVLNLAALGCAIWRAPLVDQTYLNIELLKEQQMRTAIAARPIPNVRETLTLPLTLMMKRDGDNRFVADNARTTL
jgi:hypothetical protein